MIRLFLVAEGLDGAIDELFVCFIGQACHRLRRSGSVFPDFSAFSHFSDLRTSILILVPE